MNEIIFIVDEALEGGIACSPGGQQLSLDGDLPVFHLNVTAGAEILQDNDHMGKRVGEDPLQCALTTIILRVK
jgi:hypothetical protein